MMMMFVHVRRVLARRPWLYWAGVAGLAVLAGGLVSHAASGIDDAKAAWGEPRAVLVAVADVEPGGGRPAGTEPREDPGAVVPSGAGRGLPPSAIASRSRAVGSRLRTTASWWASMPARSSWPCRARPPRSSLRPPRVATSPS